MRRAQSFVDIEKTLLDESMREAAKMRKGDSSTWGVATSLTRRSSSPTSRRYVGVEYDETYGTSYYKRTNPRADVTYGGDRLPFRRRLVRHRPLESGR